MAIANHAIPARFDPTQQHRRAMIAKINIARQQLNMVEDDYRQLLFDSTGRISLKECDDRQLGLMIDALKGKGFKPLPKGQPRGKKGVAQHPVAMKARALWISLYQLGVVHNPAEEALEAFAKRQTGCERMVWMNQSQGYRLIEALKSMAVRAGWLQHDPNTGKHLAPLALQSGLCHSILAKLKAAGAVPQDWWIDVAAERLCGVTIASAWSSEDYARVADALGAKLRELAPTGATGI